MTNELINRAVTELAAKAKEAYGNKLKQVIMFGSCARGDYTNESDIDVLLLLDVSAEEVPRERKAIFPIVHDIDRNFNYEILMAPIIQSYQQFEEYVNVMPFYKNILREGVHYE